MSGETAPHTGTACLRYYKAVPVPYVAAWSAERETDVVGDGFVLRIDAVTGQPQLRYRDEHPADRDSHGILWHRVAWAPGVGRPAYADIHTTRQRRAITHALCQICAGSGEVWLTPSLLWDAHLAEHGPGAPYQTSDPPVCRSCYELAVRYCPELARGHLLLKPDNWAIAGVRGQVADPVRGGFSHPRTLALPTATRTPNRTALGLLLAKGLVVTLYRPKTHADPDTVTGLGPRIEPPLG